MQKLLLFSLILAMVAIPMRAARQRSAARGMRRTVVGFIAYVAVYVVAIVYLLPRL